VRYREDQRGQALDQAVERRLCLGVNPVQIFKDQQEWLDLAFAQQHALEPVERALAPLRWVEVAKRALLRQHLQQRQEGREHVLEGLVEGEHLPGHLLP
jgi:hypothetical protein